MTSRTRRTLLCVCLLAAFAAAATFVASQSFRGHTTTLISASGGFVKTSDPYLYHSFNRVFLWLFPNGRKLQGPINYVQIGPKGDLPTILARLKREDSLERLFIEDAGGQQIPPTLFDGWPLLRYAEIRRGMVHGILSHMSPSVTDIHIEGSALSDEDMGQLKCFPLLRRLSVKNNPISDVGVESLKGLSIESLDLSGTKITDDSGPTLAAIPDLQNLFVDDTAVSSLLVERMGEMVRLENFGAANTALDDAGVCLMSRNWKLRDLTIHGTKTSHRAIECACQIEGLTSISVGGQTVRDVDIDTMMRHPTLTIVDLVNGDAEMLRSLDLSKLVKVGKGVYLVTDNGIDQKRILVE